MGTKILNKDLLPGNTCFGCGLDNPNGLHVEIFRDEEQKNRLRGVFHPPHHVTGFPGITHGGAIYTALDCLAAWVPTALRRETKAIWILRSANITYHRPSHEAEDLLLNGVITQEGGQGEPMLIHAEARNQQEDLLAEADFKVIPLPAEKFKKVAKIERLPENWSALLAENS